MKRALVLVVLATSAAEARDARVTATTPTTLFVDAGASDGLRPGAAWTAAVGGATLTFRVAAVAAHDALLEVDGGGPPAIGASIPLPAGLVAIAPVALRPPPVVMPPWHDDPSVTRTVQAAAAHEQPVRPDEAGAERVRGELALTVFTGGDLANSSTSWQDLGLSSQLEIARGPWQYDHLIDAHLAGQPELFTAPLQHARARFDVYLLRLAYAPLGARYAGALGRQPGAPLAELGAIDGARLRLALGPRFDVTLFGGLRPADDLALSAAPRAGADLGWQRVTGDTHARADLGVAIDARGGALDRAQAAGSLAVSRGVSFARADSVVDLASDATGAGARLTRLAGLVRTQVAGITASAQGGFDRPFLDRELAATLGDLAGLRLAPRTFGELDVRYPLRRQLELGAMTRAAWGDGVWSGYADVSAAWIADRMRVTAAPHVILGTLTDEVGLRGSVDTPRFGWSFGFGGEVDRVVTGGAWAGLGRVSASRSFWTRWRTALSVEVAAGDGPPRLLAFGLLAYRFGK